MGRSLEVWSGRAARLLSVCSLSCCFAGRAEAAPKRGEFLQTDTLSMTLASRDYTADKTTTVSDAVNLSALLGIHYYFVDRVRFGVTLQTTARLWPEPEPDASRLQRLAFLPQIGWNFADPFYAAVVFAYAPRTRGKSIPDMSVAPLLGLSIPVSEGVRWSVALETPYAFYYHQVLSVSVLTGLGFRL